MGAARTRRHRQSHRCCMKSSEVNRPAWVAETLNAANRDTLRPVALFLGAVAVITLASCTMGYSAPVTCDQRGCSDWQGAKQIQTRHARRSIDANGNAVVIGRRPAGCPRRFCGCEASLYVFGKIKPELNLALNWKRKFPRTSPAPGMAAARSGHVFILISHVEGDLWLSHDGNSGGGLTRRHVRTIRGYTIVNPHGSYAER